MRHAYKLLCTAAIAMAAVQAPPPPGEPGIISVEWMNVTRALRTVNAFQTVVNVATVRDAPFHDAIYERIASLGAPYQRYVPWLLYPKLGVAELEPPSHGGLCGFVNSGGPSGIWSTTIDCASRGAGACLRMRHVILCELVVTSRMRRHASTNTATAAARAL